MTPFQPGRLVTSTAGRDRGERFLVYRIDGDGWVWIVDGDTRPVEKPKKKNPKHLQAYDVVDEEIARRWSNGEAVTNADVQQVLGRLTKGLEEAG